MTSSAIPEELRRSSTHLLVDALGDDLTVDDDIEHHLVRVLRLRSGEWVTATDGRGSWRRYRAEVAERVVTLRADGETQVVDRRRLPLVVATAIPKGDRVDWLVQKATELGVDHLAFVHAARSTVRWKPDRAAKQLGRLQRVADEALRQSRRVHRVVLTGPHDPAEVLPDAVVAEPGGRRLEPSDRRVAIGPEGGWTPDELALAGDRVDLGPAVLRTETAVIAACVLLQS